MRSIIAIIGRPNVGKSTLFNRLIKNKKSITKNEPGVTRDRIYGESYWNNKKFIIIDTGGYTISKDNIIQKEICSQVKIAISECNLIIFLVECSGITPLDEIINKLLKKSEKKIFLVVNKVDSNKQLSYTYEFYKLGYDKIYPISSNSGSGTGDLLDDITKFINCDDNIYEEVIPKIALVGRPNSGKSTLINSLLGEKKVIVSEISGTTRDYTENLYNKFGYKYLLIDTAGIRRKNRVIENIEFYSIIRSIKAIEQCDICLIIIDSTKGMESQDLNIFNIAKKNKKGIILIMNKWDLIKDKNNISAYIKIIKHKISPLIDIPILFISALNKQRIYKTIQTINEIFLNKKNRVKTSELNEFLLPIIKQNPPPAIKGKYIKIKYITQLPTQTPQFAFFCNLPQYVKDPYKRFLENRIRTKYNFTGIPIDIFFRQK